MRPTYNSYNLQYLALVEFTVTIISLIRSPILKERIQLGRLQCAQERMIIKTFRCCTNRFLGIRCWSLRVFFLVLCVFASKLQKVVHRFRMTHAGSQDDWAGRGQECVLLDDLRRWWFVIAASSCPFMISSNLFILLKSIGIMDRSIAWISRFWLLLRVLKPWFFLLVVFVVFLFSPPLAHVGQDALNLSHDESMRESFSFIRLNFFMFVKWRRK